jgi:hypothetical protein
MHVSILVEDSVQEGVILRTRAGALEFETYCDEKGFFRYVFPIRALFDKVSTQESPVGSMWWMSQTSSRDPRERLSQTDTADEAGEVSRRRQPIVVA